MICKIWSSPWKRGKLFMLQTRNGKRTAAAAVKAAVDMVDEGLIDKETALMRLEPLQINQLLHPGIDPNAKLDEIAHGLPASPGAACGQVVFDADTAEELGKAGKKGHLGSYRNHSRRYSRDE